MTDAAARPALVRRGLRLNYLTIGYNALEAIVALAAGIVAGSVALVGFGVDSVIEVTAHTAWKPPLIWLAAQHSTGYRSGQEG